MPTPSISQLLQQTSTLLQQWNAREAELRGWMAGSATGGPNGDGRFPLTDASGRTVLALSLPALAATVEGPAGLSLAARLLAEAARDSALSYRDAAGTYATSANASKLATETARDLTKTYRDDAAAHAYNLLVTRQASESAAESSALARDVAVGARDATVQAKGDTLVARAEAVQARDEAQAHASSINPALLATKAELSSEIAALVGSSPETLNALDEFAAALGNDPNFATTITNQLAGKADKVHAHGLADITGLQTALDGKQPVGSYLQTTGGSIAGILAVNGAGVALNVNSSNGNALVLSVQRSGAIGGYIGTDGNGIRLADKDVNTVLDATFNSLAIPGQLVCASLRLNAAATAHTGGATHRVPVSLNGTTYYLLLTT